MPPKRRQPRAPDSTHPDSPSPPPERDHSAREDDDPEDDDDDNSDNDQDDISNSNPTTPFYNTTFSAHRLSPLHLGRDGQLTPPRLRLLAQRLRDQLVGDVVRGVRVGAPALGGEDLGLASSASVVGRAGALESVEISWVGVADVLGIGEGEVEGLDALGQGQGHEADGVSRREENGVDWRRVAAELPGMRALHVAIRYELASCTALVLPGLLGEDGKSAPEAGRLRFAVGGRGADDEMDWEGSVDSTHFLSLPLLLLRMPAPIKTVVADFLAATFDCRVSPMRLGTRSLVRSWEAWIRTAGLSAGRPAKDVVLSLGFYVPAPEKSGSEQGQAEQQEALGIRSIEVIVPALELEKFVAAGKRLAPIQTKQTSRPASWGWEHDLKKRRELAGRLYEEGWEWRLAGASSRLDQPFTEALACYLKEHLALNLFHPGVRITKIGCAGFAMSESRLKVFAPARSGEADGEGLALLAQKGAVLELLGGLTSKAQVQTMSV